MHEEKGGGGGVTKDLQKTILGSKKIKKRREKINDRKMRRMINDFRRAERKDEIQWNFDEMPSSQCCLWTPCIWHWTSNNDFFKPTNAALITSFNLNYIYFAGSKQENRCRRGTSCRERKTLSRLGNERSKFFLCQKISLDLYYAEIFFFYSEIKGSKMKRIWTKKI